MVKKLKSITVGPQGLQLNLADETDLRDLGNRLASGETVEVLSAPDKMGQQRLWLNGATLPWWSISPLAD